MRYKHRGSPPVTVAMPVHNAAQFLPEAIESILWQTFTEFDFVIVDDGSTDGTGRLLADYAARDPRIRVISQQRCGLTASLNKVIRSSSSPYIARMDGDDIALPGRLEEQVRYLDAHVDCVLVGSQILLIDSAGWPLGLNHDMCFDHESICAMLMAGQGHALCHPSVVFRRTAYVDAGGYDERYQVGQDVDFFLRLSELGRVHNIDAVQLKWRQHKSSLHRTVYAERARLKRRMLREAQLRRGIVSSLPDEAVLYRRPNPDIHLDLAQRAANGGYLASMSKHLLLSLLRHGPRIGHARCLRRAFKARNPGPASLVKE